jgi:hypothetical protein
MISNGVGKAEDAFQKALDRNRALLDVRRLWADNVGTLSDCSAEMMGVWAEELRRSNSDRAVRRKPLVRSGQGVSVYGFSMASIAGVVAEESGR